MNRRDFQRAFAPAPEHFINCIDTTLKEIEDMKNRSEGKARRAGRPLLIAAIIMVLTAATALAVIAHHHLLKATLTSSGAGDLVEQVVDVESSAVSEDFSVTLDEYLWGEENLLLSCTLAVPDDGKTYLAGIMTPQVDGELVDYQTALYFDAPDSMTVYPIGGTCPVARTLLLPVLADSAGMENGPASLKLKAVFLSTDRPVVSGNFSEEEAQQNVLYLENDNSINLLRYDEIAALLPHKDGEWYAEEWRTNGIDPEEVGAMDWVDYVTAEELTTELHAVIDGMVVYNDVDQRAFQWRDLSITVEKLQMTPFDLDLELRLVRKGGFKQNDDTAELEYPRNTVGIPGYDSMFLGLAYLDAANEDAVNRLMGDIVCRYARQNDGSLLYTFEGKGIFPISTLETLMVVPEYWTPTGHDYTYDMNLDTEDPIAMFKPVFIETSAQNKADEGGSNLVYATENGTRYHRRPDCNGMRNALEWTIDTAIAEGKEPCSDCIF